MGIISVLCVGRLKVRRPLDHETEQLTLIPDLCDSQKKKKKKEPACMGAEFNTQREGGRERGRENNGPSDSAEIYMQLCTSPLSPAWCIKWIIPFTPHTGVIVCSVDAPLPSLPLWSALESRHRFYLDRPADNHHPSQISLIKLLNTANLYQWLENTEGIIKEPELAYGWQSIYLSIYSFIYFGVTYASTLN